jgi:uncharacterized protein (TIGR00251 family)
MTEKRVLRIRVKPGSRVSELIEQPDGSWLARVKAPPVDGKANEALIELVAAHFAVRRNQVRIRSGASSRSKTVEVLAS